MKHGGKGFLKGCFAGAVLCLALGGQALAMEDGYRIPSLSGPVKTWVYQGDAYESSRNRVFADDQEDGDLTKGIKVDGSVDTSRTGTYKLTYQVTDADGRSSRMVTEVEVLDKAETSQEKKAVQRILYTLPDASHMTNIGFCRGYYHDRQSLGFWLPEGEELKIRLVNGQEFGQSLELKLMNNDSETEKICVLEEKDGQVTEETPVSSAYIPANGEWLTVKNGYLKKDGTKGSEVSVPFITTPKNTLVRPVIEIAWNDNFKELPYYRYGDNQDRFFETWDKQKAPFAIVEGDAATFLIPAVDRDRILNNSSVSEAYRFQTIDEMLEWYAAFVKQYDAYAGLDAYAKEPYNQNVRAKFFIKVNNSGVGLAYYTIDHSAHNGAVSGGSLGGYLTRDWVSLHEFGHGYEGEIAQREYPFVETTNNIMGYYFEPTYRPASDFGWLLNGYQGATKAERYALLGKRAEERRKETKSFAGIVDGGWHYDVSLFMFTNMLDKLGPEKTVAAMHTQYRRKCYEEEQSPLASDTIVESFSRSGGYNVIPYFDGWHIRPSEKMEDEIYALKLPMVYYLKNLIPEDAACEAVRKKLGLESIYSLVSTQDLAYTGYKSQVEFQVEIDDLSQILGKKIKILDGDRLVKEIEITGKQISAELPVGIYEVELPAPEEASYRYDKEYVAAGKGRAGKSFVYTKMKNGLADDTRIQFYGASDGLFATVSTDSAREKLLWSVYKIQPHFIFEDTYAGIRVEDPSGKEIFSQSLTGTTVPEEAEKEVSFPVGSRLEIYHREASGRLLFASKYTGKNLPAYRVSWEKDKISYVMTEQGLMQEDWDETRRREVYLETLFSYSDTMLELMTRQDLYRQESYYNQKTVAAQACRFLPEEIREDYLKKYGVLVGREPKSYTEYRKIDSSRLTGTADSDQGGNEGAASAVDGKEDTMWHSNYGNGTKPDISAGAANGYTILLDKAEDIGRLEYVPRKNGNNGIITSFRLLYSTQDTGDDFKELSVRSHVWAKDNTKKSVEFSAPGARRIRIEALASEGNPENTFISAAEFYLYETYEVAVGDTYVGDLSLESVKGTVHKDKTEAGQSISLFLGGQQVPFEKGLSLGAGASVVVNLKGKPFEILSAMAGADSQKAEDAELLIYGDGKELYRSGTLTKGKPARPVYVELRGVEKLELRVSGQGSVLLGGAALKSSKHLTELCLKQGETAAILSNTALIPEIREKITWESSNPGAVSVEEGGVVKAKAEGTAVIKGTYQGGTITCQVAVEKPSEASSGGSGSEVKPPQVTPPGNGGNPGQKVTKPKKAVLRKVKPGRRQVDVTWKKTAKADGYEVWMRTGKGKFKKAKILKAKKLTVRIKKLKKGKKCSFKVRAFRKQPSGKKVYGAFSKVKTVKIK